MLFFRFCLSLSPFCTVCALSQGPRVSAVLILRPLQKVTRSEPHRSTGSLSSNPGPLFPFRSSSGPCLNTSVACLGNGGKSEGGGLIY